MFFSLVNLIWRIWGLPPWFRKPPCNPSYQLTSVWLPQPPLVSGPISRSPAVLQSARFFWGATPSREFRALLRTTLIEAMRGSSGCGENLQINSWGMHHGNSWTSLWMITRPGYDIHSSPWFFRWPIEIDGLPNLKLVDLSMAMLNNQMVPFMPPHLKIAWTICSVSQFLNHWKHEPWNPSKSQAAGHVE